MKTILENSDERRVSSLRCASTRQASDKAGSASRFTFHVSRPASAFTLVEMLIVIAIIAILAALLLPVLAGAHKAALKKQAALEIGQIVGAIQQYDSIYGRFPVSALAQNQAGLNAQAGLNPDFTYGGVFQTPAGNTMSMGTVVAANNNLIMSNDEVIAILMNYTNYPNNPGRFTANTNYQKNPQQTLFLNAKMSGWDPSAPQPGTPLPGVGNDLVYRDPWGNPYVISMDLNYDEQCQDAFYCLTTVSSTSPGSNPTSGLNGLINPDTTKNDNYRYHGKVMVWSAGPDGQIDPTPLPSGGSANSGVNKDNILSWQ
jgi:prepilin-type N-terminal cleavage/methylation domain-containing protein